MSTAVKEKITLRMERVIAASPQRLFELWTEPEELIKWWGPEGYTTPMHAIAVPDADPSTLKRPETAARELLDAIAAALPDQRSTEADAEPAAIQKGTR